MKFNITFEADTLSELTAKLRAAVLTPEDQGCLILGQPTVSEGRIVEIAQAAIDTAAAVPSDPVDDLYAKPTDPPPSEEEVTVVLRRLLKAKGDDFGLDLLASYGAKGVKSLAAEKRRDFINAAEEAMK